MRASRRYDVLARFVVCGVRRGGDLVGTSVKLPSFFPCHPHKFVLVAVRCMRVLVQVRVHRYTRRSVFLFFCAAYTTPRGYTTPSAARLPRWTRFGYIVHNDTGGFSCCVEANRARSSDRSPSSARVCWFSRQDFYTNAVLAQCNTEQNKKCT